MAMQKPSSFNLFGLPLVHPINVILISNLVVQIIQYLLGEENLGKIFTSYFALIPVFVLEHGFFWQCFSYGFLHSTSGLPLHFLFNMYALFLFGKSISFVVGKVHFLALYLVSLIGGGITVVVVSYLKYHLTDDISILATPTLGASAAIFGLILVFGNFFPDVVFEFFLIPVPIKAEYLLILSIAIGLVLTYVFGFPISNEGHIGGALFGGIYYLIFLRNYKVTRFDMYS